MSSILKRITRAKVSRLAALLLRLGEEQRLVDLRAKLAHCGERTVLRYPLHVEQPEKVSIGADVSLNPFIHVWGGGGVEIGDRTMIASHVALTSLTHDPDNTAMHASLIAGKIQIANDVWIGTHAVILPGVVIGEHAVVAAGAVVRESIPPYTVVAGVPARIIRTKAKS